MALIFSCSDDILDVENPNNISLDYFWNSEGDIQKGLVALMLHYNLMAFLVDHLPLNIP